MVREADAQPTVEGIRELFAHNSTYWNLQDGLDREMRALTLNAHTVLVPDTRNKKRKLRTDPEKMTTGIGAHSLEVVSSLYVTPANVGVRHVGDTQVPGETAERVEVALAEARALLNPVTDSPRSREIKQMLAFGRRAQLIIPGHVAWFDAPRFQQGEGNERETNVIFMQRRRDWRRVAPIPIFWQDLTPETTFPPSLGRLEDEILSTYTSSWNELLDQFTKDEIGEALPPAERRHELVTVAIYANRVWITWAVMADTSSGGRSIRHPLRHPRGDFPDKIIREFKHGMGRNPIRIVAAKTGPMKEPGIYWRGILYGAREMIPQVDARFSEAATASHFTALPWLKYMRNRRGDETSSQAAANVQEMLAMDLAVLDAGGEGQPHEDLLPVHMPAHGDKSLLLGQFQLELIRRITGVTDAIEGLPGPAASTAWERNFTAELAKGFFKEITDNVVAGDVDTMEQISRAAQAWDEDIFLAQHSEGGGAVVLVPEELRQFETTFEGEYKLRLPANRRADLEQGISMMERVKASELPIDLFWIMEEFLDIEQPIQMFKQAVKSRFITSPRMWKWQEDKLLEEADVRLADEEGISLEQFEAQFADRVSPNSAQMIRTLADPTGELQGSNQAQRGPVTGGRSGGPQPVEQTQ